MTVVPTTESRPQTLNYLENLTWRLATGVGRLPEEIREIHAHYLEASQLEDGGFGGREDGSDLYYTSFALRGLAITGKLFGTVAESAASFLRGQFHGQTPVIDFLSLLYSAKILESSAGIDVLKASQPDWQQHVVATLEACHREDGGYAKGPTSGRSSTYHTFLTLLCLELLNTSPAAPERIVDFLHSQQRPDGGFVEFAPMRRSGTNPTAAAIGSLRILDRLSEDVRERTAQFFADMQTLEGGLRANTRIPIADLLSSFTGLLTLLDLGSEDQIRLPELVTYVEQLADPEGGFHGAAWDEGKDVEYTFYGLGTLALLASC